MPPKKKFSSLSHSYNTDDGYIVGGDSNLGLLYRLNNSLPQPPQYTTVPKRIIGNSNDIDIARDNYWNHVLSLNNEVDSIANAYGISPDLLKTRLDHEGFTDSEINYINDLNKRAEKVNPSSYRNSLKTASDSGFDWYGLDDVPYYINAGYVHPINERWKTEQNVNEKNRKVISARGLTNLDNIGLVAATLQGFRNLAKKDFPGRSEEDYDRYASSYYNHGIAGGRKWVNDGAKGYKIRRRLSTAGKKSK